MIDRTQVNRSVLSFVLQELDVLPWLIVSGKRLAYVVEARALAAMLLRGSGLSCREAAHALRLQAPSSLHELIESYRDRPALRAAVARYAEDKTSFSVSQAFGNSNTPDFEPLAVQGGAA